MAPLLVRELRAPLVDAFIDALESAELGCTVVVDDGDRLERVYANPSAARICGRNLEEFKELSVLGMVVPEDRARLAALRAPLDGKAAPAVVETTLALPDGSRRPVRVALGFATIDGMRATFCFIRDLSNESQMAAELRGSEERFRVLAEASRDSITVIADRKYIYANPVALKILGLRSVDELDSVDPWSRVPPERAEEMRGYWERLQKGDPMTRIENRVTMPDGREVILESSLSVTTMGGRRAVISYTRDITERMQLQAELVNRDRLASLGVLAAGVGHELNNPLASVGLLARKLRESAETCGLPEDMKLAIEQIDEGARRMSAIIADLLFMARPVEQPQAHVDAAQVLASTIALLRAGAVRLPRIDVQLAELPPIRGFSSKLGQVFINVLKNAIQALEGKDDGLIRVVGRVLEGTDTTIELVISDNGGGIPADLLPRVTQPFFTTKAEGTGLGLWISQTLVAQHGGSLDVANGETGGARVTIRLPVQ